MIADLKFKNLRILLNLSNWDSHRKKLPGVLLASRTVQEWTAQTLQLCLVQIELTCSKSGTKLKLFLTFLSINYQKAGGGFSPIRVNNREVLSAPFPKPEDEFDLLIGDWNSQSRKVIYPIT
ncbi:hypothetical protein NC653_026300 [Populus alba x Populus x berolinensis]|uniref:Uncharacterized protein n=1 Tax=Populus alba x Populus x berolinensis TaxID=444605 RepID=A0AAD6MEJ4_9ROSI|nr:hypothetical protein NC653_026300 [Populus alba x Populus x berolinensis]